MKKYIYLFSIILLTSCSAVSYSPYQVELLRPADYTLPSTIEKVAIVNCVDVSKTTDLLATDKQKEQLEYLHKMPGMICSFMSSNITKSGFLTAVTASKRYDLETIMKYSDLICDTLDCQAIICLRDYSYESSLWRKQKNDMTCLTLLASTSTQMAFVVHGKTYDLQARKDTLEWTFCDEREKEAMESMPKYNDVYYSASEDVGETYASLIVPAWEKVTRYVMFSDKKSMRDAVEWIRRDDWEAAFGLWLEEQQTASGAERGRAQYDIALYYEHIGDLEQAGIWCSKALDTYGSGTKKTESEVHLAQYYFEEILKRKEECAKLDKQIK